jgi:hypothetical protein
MTGGRLFSPVPDSTIDVPNRGKFGRGQRVADLTITTGGVV